MAEPMVDSVNRIGPCSRETDRLRILAVIPGDGRGFNFATRQVLLLAKLGVDIRTFFLTSRTSPLALIRALVELRRIMQQFRPQVLHAHFGTVTSFFCAISGKTPLVITFRGSDLQGSPGRPIRSVLGKVLSQISCLRASRILCVTRGLRDRLRWRRDQVEIVPSGTNLELFQPHPRDQARALLGWDADLPIVLFSGADRPSAKGLDIVQSAIRVAEKMVGPIQLQLLYTWSYPFEMMPYCLSAADCLAMASINEGSPNIVKEALACNLPVVSTDVGDVAERLKDVHPSKIVARDSAAFGEAIAEVLLQKRRSNGRERGDLWSEADVARMLVSVYSAVRRTHGREVRAAAVAGKTAG